MSDRHDDDCNVWTGCQQCDGPDLTRACTCHVEALAVDDADQAKTETDVLARWFALPAVSE